MSDSLKPHGLFLPGCSVHGILQARILEWVSLPFSMEPSQPREQTPVSNLSCIGQACSLLLMPHGKPNVIHPMSLTYKIVMLHISKLHHFSLKELRGSLQLPPALIYFCLRQSDFFLQDLCKIVHFLPFYTDCDFGSVFSIYHSKGDNSWVFIGRSDAEAETLVLWQPHVKS